jgi:hypothetical protein
VDDGQDNGDQVARECLLRKRAALLFELERLRARLTGQGDGDSGRWGVGMISRIERRRSANFRRQDARGGLPGALSSGPPRHRARRFPGHC